MEIKIYKDGVQIASRKFSNVSDFKKVVEKLEQQLVVFLDEQTKNDKH